MHGRLGLAVVLLLAIPLAGCLGGEKVESAGTDAAAAEALAAAPEGRGRILAFEETNATEDGVGGLDHHHDYWEGRERVTLLEKRASYGASTGDRWVTLRPAQGDFVFEATEAVEVVASAPTREGQADPLGAPAPKLRYKHAATTEWIEAGALSWGEPFRIEVTNPAQTDMPHATWSLWAFELRSGDALTTYLSFDVRIDILRGPEDIPLWPGHPAFYTDSSVREVLRATARTAENGITGDAMPIGEESTGPVAAQKVVSYGTRTLFVYVNIRDLQVTNPLDTPTNFWLLHSNASGVWNHTDYFDVAGKHPADKREHLWILHVDEGGMDSPYADGSRFEFQLRAAFAKNTPVLYFTCYGGCATWSADYEITVLATDQELDPELYD
jgi:hypothetical protein